MTTTRTICPECRLEARAESARLIQGYEAEILRLAAIIERQGMRNLLAAVEEPEPAERSTWHTAMLMLAGGGVALAAAALMGWLGGSK